jgi:nucleoside-diphosphate-sugar epimerase
MVIGNGLIAGKFGDYLADEEKIIFASGVSNSKNINSLDFVRETELLKNVLTHHQDKILIYFSTCSIDDNDLNQTPYVHHKLQIEHFIKQNVHNYYLFRVSNVAGFSNNPYTLLNYFVFKILGDQTFDVWKNAYRNIIDIDDMYIIINKILKEQKFLNQTINIANRENYSVPVIIKKIDEHLNKKARYNEVEKGNNFKISISLIEPLIKELEIEFDENYLSRLLKKYYHSK